MSLITIYLQNYNNLIYYISAQFGGLPTQFLGIDTGSSDTWARGTQCVSLDQSCDGNKMGKKGGTYYGSTFQEKYADGTSITGEIYSGSPNFNGITPSLIYYGNATEINGLVHSIDGILGLAQLQGSDIYLETGHSEALFMNSLGISQFGLYFNNYKNETATTCRMNINGYDSALYQGSLTWIPTTSNTYWQMSLYSGTVSVFGNSFPLDTGPVRDMVFDTGSSFIFLSNTAVEGICSNIVGCAYDPLSQFYIFPCTSYLPNMEFNIGGNTWTIPGFHYSYNYTSQTKGDRCVLMITSQNALSTSSLMGTPFFRTYYTAYDLATGQFGYALAN